MFKKIPSFIVFVCFVLLSFSANAQCPEDKTPVTVTLPSGAEKVICIDEGAIGGLENAADHSSKTIFNVACNDNSDCSDTEYCARPEGVCGSGPGYCATKPTICPAVYDPVCGCDGQTYVNFCEAGRVGENVNFRNACN